MSTVSEINATRLRAREIAQVTAYLESTRDALAAATSGLSEVQLRYKPAPEVWSIAQNVEHLAIVEGFLHIRISQLPNSPEAEPDRENIVMDELVVREVPLRKIKVQTPSAAEPSGNASPAEVLERFNQSRSKTVQLASEAPCLRGRLMKHPVLGDLDGYQWLLAVGAHTARHTNQIAEVKSDPGFPA